MKDLKIIDNRDFRPIPFWFLNDRLEKEEIDRQLILMKESGVSGFYMHARCGLDCFGDEGWFNAIAYIVEKAAEYGLDANLFDEDCYPSGNASGRIAAERPDLISRRIVVEKLSPENGEYYKELGDQIAVAAYAVKDGKCVRRLDGCFGYTRKAWYGKKLNLAYYHDQKPVAHDRSAAYSPQLAFRAKAVEGEETYIAYARRNYTINRYGSLVDTVHPESVELFKKYCLDGYGSVCGKPNVKAMFTDEPIPGGVVPFSAVLFEGFEKEHGYSLEDELFSLYYDVNERSPIVRRDYYRTASRMFAENFVDGLRDFCSKKGIAFVGHFESEDSLFYQILKASNIYENVSRLDFPGMDLICGITGGKEHLSLVFGAKIISSIAAQRGIAHTFCEVLALNPYNFGLDGMYRIVDWCFSVGVNTFVPHGFYYGYSGMRKRDAGKSYFFQDPSFGEFPTFSKYCDRVGKFTTEGEFLERTLLVVPDWEAASYGVAFQEQTQRVQTELLRVISLLEEAKIPYDVAYCKQIADLQSGEKITIGNKTYEVAIFPYDGNVATKEIAEKLSSLDAKTYFAKGGTFDVATLKSQVGALPFTIVQGCDGDFSVKARKIGNGLRAFVCNTSKTCLSFTVDTDGEVYLWDAKEDVYYRVKKGEQISLRGADGVGILINPENAPKAEPYVYTEYPVRSFEYEESPEWNYTPPIAVKKTVNAYTVRVKSEKGEEIFDAEPYALLRAIYGADLLKQVQKIPHPVYDDSKYVGGNYPVTASYTATFELSEKAATMLFEEETFPLKAKVYLNGIEISREKWTRKTVYDFRNLEADVSTLTVVGENILEVRMEQAEDTDGVMSDVYFY